ncbi:ABC transporter substrate-binding protein, partial [Alphaproteobacteria bacterium]|nr:ABC transporter substrate-binding protein [Alphaproteobacteria bacterium]
TRAGREGKFAALLNERANIRRIARFTLGQFGRKISKEDFASFEKLLGQFIVKVYANRLGEYSDEKVIVGKAQAKKKNVIVESRIEFANGRDPIDIDWWLRLEKDGSMTLFDVRVLGVWMAQEQRDAFSSVLKNNKGDINALLDHLRKQIKADAAEK